MNLKDRPPSLTWHDGLSEMRRQAGKVGWILLWLLGVPLPILFVLYLLRGCT